MTWLGGGKPQFRLSILRLFGSRDLEMVRLRKAEVALPVQGQSMPMTFSGSKQARTCFEGPRLLRSKTAEHKKTEFCARNHGAI
jgi:hypothetical protein